MDGERFTRVTARSPEHEKKVDAIASALLGLTPFSLEQRYDALGGRTIPEAWLDGDVPAVLRVLADNYEATMRAGAGDG